MNFIENRVHSFGHILSLTPPPFLCLLSTVPGLHLHPRSSTITLVQAPKIVTVASNGLLIYACSCLLPIIRLNPGQNDLLKCRFDGNISTHTLKYFGLCLLISSPLLCPLWFCLCQPSSQDCCDLNEDEYKKRWYT